jgi:hypothetical protein
MALSVDNLPTRIAYFAALTLLTLAWSIPALAAPRTTRGGRSLRWQHPDITLSLSTNDLPAGLTADQALLALRDAASTWSHPTVACTAVSIHVVVLEGANVVENDGVNVVAFRKRQWCRDGVMRRGSCYDARAAAMTTVHHGAVINGSKDMAIDDADIELNAHDFGWRIDAPTTTTASTTLDLREALRHEIGHVLGFTHVCEPVARSRIALPSCAELPTTERMSVMLPGADSVLGPPPGDRRLTTADVAALCSVYAAPKNTTHRFGCAVVRPDAATSGSAWLSLAFVTTLLMLVRGQRRKLSKVRRA